MCNHVTIVPPLRALLESPDLRLDGFIGPGHVCDRRRRAAVRSSSRPTTASRWSISGFEPLDLLQSVLMILRQLADGRREVENQYTRVVPWEGNLRALEVMAEVFELRPHFEWRGLGFISQSALKLSDAYAELRRRAALLRARRARGRPQGVPVRRGAQGRHQAVGVQGVRHRVHARARRSARAWSPPRARAPPTTTTAASRASGRSSDARRSVPRRARSGSSGSSRPRAPSARSSGTRRSRCPTAPAARRRRRSSRACSSRPSRITAGRSTRWPTRARSRSTALDLALTTDSLRRQAAPLPRRLDRRAGGQRDGQRPRGGGRAAARAHASR